ncbi:MAG TPA: MFS transporter, partial [Rhodospirillales bacterium]|nr:MFS transporter [Rhodospirillales bacterium]
LPIAAHLADRSGERRRPMRRLAAISVLTFALFAVADGFWPIIAVSLLFFSLWPPVMSLGESLTVMAAQRDGFEYGRVRLWGSLAFIVTALAAGAVLARVPADAVYWMILGGVALTALACVGLPDIRAKSSRLHRLPILAALRQRSLLLLLTGCGLIQGSHAVYYAFGTLHWRAAGYSEAVIGALWAEGVLCEVVLFACGAWAVRRFGAAGLIVMAGLAGAVRWLGTGLIESLPALVVLQALHALSFGAAHLGAMHWIGRNIDPALSATAQSLYSAIVFGLFLGGLLYAAGLLYAGLGGNAFLPMAAVAVAGALAALPLLRRQRRRV